MQTDKEKERERERDKEQEKAVELANTHGSVVEEPSNKFIDKLSLEFLLNKTQYQKYLQKTDPQKFAEMQEFSENCARLSRPIMDMTMRLLQDPKTDRYSQEVQDAFHVYADALIRYLEIKEMTDQVQEEYDENRGHDDDENTLFPASMDNGIDKEDQEEEEVDAVSSTSFPGIQFHVPRSRPQSQQEGAWWKRSSK